MSLANAQNLREGLLELGIRPRLEQCAVMAALGAPHRRATHRVPTTSRISRRTSPTRVAMGKGARVTAVVSGGAALGVAGAPFAVAVDVALALAAALAVACGSGHGSTGDAVGGVGESVEAGPSWAQSDTGLSAHDGVSQRHSSRGLSSRGGVRPVSTSSLQDVRNAARELGSVGSIGMFGAAGALRWRRPAALSSRGESRARSRRPWRQPAAESPIRRPLSQDGGPVPLLREVPNRSQLAGCARRIGGGRAGHATNRAARGQGACSKCHTA